MSRFVCPWCSRESSNPKDAQEGYCGACHEWTGPTLVYFGQWWDVPALEHARQLPEVPTYAQCLRCQEHFAEGDQGLVFPHMGELEPEYVVGVGRYTTFSAMHRECQLSEIAGHLVGVCSCTGHGRDRASAREVARRVDGGALHSIGEESPPCR